MASIIEKETGHGPDRRRVSGVFANRLKIGMLLQTDPTVIYGMGDAYQGRIRKRDLQTDTPWNTIPGPACRPRRSRRPAVRRCWPRCSRNSTSTCSSCPRATAPANSGQPERAQPQRVALHPGPGAGAALAAAARAARPADGAGAAAVAATCGAAAISATVAGPTAGATGTTRTRRMTSRGRFITLEGVDGAGKSTHTGWIADFLRAGPAVANA